MILNWRNIPITLINEAELPVGFGRMRCVAIAHLLLGWTRARLPKNLDE